MRRALVVLFVVAGGCAVPQKAPYTVTPVPVREAGGFECSAEAAQYAIGRKSSVALASELMAKTGSKLLRWMPPRTAATMDYRSDRLNIAYDDSMTITQVSCG